MSLLVRMGGSPRWARVMRSLSSQVVQNSPVTSERQTIAALPRVEEGSNAVNILRKNGEIPAVLYGEGINPPQLLKVE